MILWLLRFIFPDSGWYIYAASDWDIPARVGPFSKKSQAKQWETDTDYFNVWVRFNLW